MTLSQFLNIKNNQSTLGTLVNTSDDLFNDYIIEHLIEKHQLSQGECDIVRFDLAKQGFLDLVSELTQSSLFSSKKIIIVNDLELLTTKGAISKQKKAVDKFIKILESQSLSDSYLIFNFKYPKLDERKKLTKVLKNTLMTITDTLSYKNISQFVQELCQKDNYEIDIKTANLLAKRSEFNIGSIIKSVEKVKIACIQTKKITAKIVEENIEQALSDNVFDILTFALNKQYQQGVNLLADQLNQGVNEIQIIAAMLSQLRFLLQVKILQANKLTNKQIESKLKAHPYRIKLAIQNQISIQNLVQLVNRLIEMDFKIKSGYQYHGDFLKRFLIEC